MITNTYKFILISATIFSFGIAPAFSQAVSDVTGKNYRVKNAGEITGNPYFTDTFEKGIVKLKSGKVLNGLNLKYDLLDDVLLYKDSRDSTMQFDEPIAEFKLASSAHPESQYHLFRAGFNKTNGNTDNSFYEILSDGNTKFVKKNIKYIKEFTDYNAKSATKSFEEKTTYYVVKPDNTPVAVSKTEKSILAALADKQAELAAFIKTQKLNLKKDTDILKAFEYYQSLK